MRYLIASDIHGALPAAEALMERFREEGADRLLLLGDLLYHGPRNPLPTGYAPAEVARLLNRYADRITAVRGNCEAEVDQMMLDFPCLGDYTLVVDEGTTLLLTHGHLNLGTVVAGLPAGSFVFSGHSHIKGIGPQAAPAFVRDAFPAADVPATRPTTDAETARVAGAEWPANAAAAMTRPPPSPSSTPGASATQRTALPATRSTSAAP